MTDPRVLIRADAGMGVGHGHLVRVLAIARELVARGCDVTVVTRATGERARGMIAAAGARCAALPALEPWQVADGPVWATSRQEEDAARVLDVAEGPWHAVVVDHYHLDARWEGLLRPHASRLVAVDDLADRPHDVDVLVDHNWYGPGTAARYRRLVPEGTTQLLGPRYALLHTEYRDARTPQQERVHPPRHVVVSFGGTDVSGQTLTAFRALDVVPEATITVVVGERGAVTEALRSAVDQRAGARLCVELPGLASVLRSADLAIGAGGTSTWERFCLGVPALVTTVSENQSGVTRAFHEEGMTRWIGVAGEVGVDDYRDALRAYLNAAPLDIPPIVDGYGAARVALAVVPPRGEPSVRPARLEDDASFVTAGGAGIGDDGGAETWRRRAAWFARAVGEGAAVQIVEREGTPVGVIGGPDGAGVRLDPHAAVPSASGGRR